MVTFINLISCLFRELLLSKSKLIDINYILHF